jgi:hypothetical protein
MKERIKLLVEQAEDWADKQNFYESDYRDYLMEKFAELIIKDCVDTLEFHGFEDAVPYIKWMATNKLGVE